MRKLAALVVADLATRLEAMQRDLLTQASRQHAKGFALGYTLAILTLLGLLALYAGLAWLLGG